MVPLLIRLELQMMSSMGVQSAHCHPLVILRLIDHIDHGPFALGLWMCDIQEYGRKQSFLSGQIRELRTAQTDLLMLQAALVVSLETYAEVGVGSCESDTGRAKEA